ncbi:MAG: 23S rRNA (pseudouridine(1915)-N(3))-methyltransferase RlmH [Blastocatellia bacterium]|nr:23S rRNA (pseudouridine(1915)-N(3))-methyltransferase RlmH [Blastocatellia bacterium]
MHLQLLWVGKTKDRRIAELISDYLQRLSKYAKYELKQLREVKATDKRKVIEAEADLILDTIDLSSYKVVLDENGQQFTSEQFAATLEKLQIRSVRELVFVVGGHFGLSERIREQADLLWSLSSLTLTHDMARLLLAEQLYRGYTILNGHPYQK